MHSRFEVRSRDGNLLGIFPAPISEHAEEVRALIDKHPGADVKPVVTLDNPCAKHPAYEAENCPACGTSATV
ncbi:hypothetical protein [Nocardioides sp. SYSU DS0651]|uniref:hypothetical protein n=1 Tax=Nocardioides sp. SYSU DS0651 TaxID=3415955 RepID=UPI003F4B0F2D